MSTGAPRIVVDLKCQLGNLLFQFAAAKQLELDGASVVFSDRTTRKSTGLKRTEQFTGASLPLASTIQEIATGYFPRMVSASPFVDFVVDSPIILPSRHRIFPTPDFDPKPSLPDWSLYRLQGYFQHRSWFDRSLASVLASLEATTRESRASIPSFDLCVHLRRGEYLSHGWELSFDYYLRCLEVMSTRFSNVVVTSDDELAAITFAHYLKSNGHDARTPTQVESSNGDSFQRQRDPVLYDFCLMANAKNVIMSNSSFCWWATALGDSVNESPSERVVAYPQGWTGLLKSDGLVQPTWQQISRT